MRGKGIWSACFFALLTVTSVNAADVDAQQIVANLQQMSDGFAAVAAQVKPGVVAIVTESVKKERMQDFRGTPFEHFFGPRSRPRERPQQGQGSGVIVSYEGDDFILTNYHVIRGADEITVEMTDERHYTAEIVGADSLSDLAALRIDANNLPSVPWGQSAQLRVGEWVMAVGNPFALEHTVTAGIVSALGRARFSIDEYGSFIQTDAAINPGNSGGALVNLEGELVGINTAIYSRSGGYQGIGFAIPVDLVRNVLSQLIEYGEVRRGLLGISIGNVNAITAEALGMETTQGILVQSVVPNSGAEKAGLESGDVIVAVDGGLVRNTTELKSRIGATPPGTTVEVAFFRDGEKQTAKVTLGQVTEETLASGRGRRRDSEEESSSALGLRLRDLTAEFAQRFGYDEAEGGVLVAEVRQGSEAARRGLRSGDLIREVDRQPVRSVKDFRAIMEKFQSGKAILFLVRRGEANRLVALRLP